MTHEKSGRTRHSYVQFYPSDWMGGVVGLPRIFQSVYFDICLFNWDKAKPIPRGQFNLITADLPPEQVDFIVKSLIEAEKVASDPVSGALYSPRAIEEAQRALRVWDAKSKGGRKARGTLFNESLHDCPTEPEPEPEPDIKKEITTVISKENDDDSMNDDSGAMAKLRAAEAQADKLREGVQVCVDAWNGMAVTCGLRQTVKITDERVLALKRLISDFGTDRLTAAIEDIAKAPYLIGHNDRKWKASFDWLLRDGTALRLIEGDYHTEAMHRLARPYVIEAAKMSQAMKDRLAKEEQEKVWTQDEIDDANRMFEKLGIETRYALDDGRCVSAPPQKSAKVDTAQNEG